MAFNQPQYKAPCKDKGRVIKSKSLCKGRLKIIQSKISYKLLESILSNGNG